MRVFVFFILSLLLAGCATPRRAGRQLRRAVVDSPVFAKGFTGFMLRDAATGEVLCDVNGDRPFTPASTLKVLTLATCLEVLGDSVPALRYFPMPENEDSDPVWYIGWVIGGTGDPTFLHPKFQAWQQPFALLKKNGLFDIAHSWRWKNRLGPGWAWDDYNEAFSPELSEMPLYGNVVRVTWISKEEGNGQWHASPAFFQPFLLDRETYDPQYHRVIRQEQSDTISLPHYTDDLPDSFSRNIPIWQANEKTDALLLDTLFGSGAKLVGNHRHCTECPGWRTLFSTPTDTVLRRMMYQSDNFIAEQMLLVCAGVKYGLLQQDTIIKWAKDSLLPVTNYPSTNYPSPRWVDGSGLSRYNLVTPRYFTEVLLQLWQKQPHQRLLSLFPAAGAPETTLDWWQPIPQPAWLFAKTGSMSGVQCMSGYLLTRRGRWLAFSFANNNFVGSGKPWKEEMKRVLEEVRARF